jgi:hypothetical protein
MKLETFLSVPKWFSVRHPAQEDAIDGLIRTYEHTEELRRKGMEQAKADALPYMAEVVRDLDSRTEATVRGGIRTWTPETYARVMADKRKRRNWLTRFLTSFTQSSRAKLT